MIYFKTFLKIMKSQMPKISIYIGIFIIISTLNMKMGSSDSSTQYTNEKINVAVIDKDNSELSQSIKQYVKDNMELTQILDTEEGIQDALFSRFAEYIIIIPEGYQDSLIKGEDVLIESREVPNSSSAIFAKTLINQYISTFNTYVKLGNDNDDIDTLIKDTNSTMEKSTNVKLTNKEENSNDSSKTLMNFGAYIIISCVIWGVSEILAIFFKKTIAQRTEISPFRPAKRNVLLVIFSLLFGIVIWILNIVVDIVVIGKDMMGIRGIYYSINLLMLTFVSIGMSYSISVLFRSRNARTGAANTIGLGLCFISGVFVPLEYIASSVRKIAQFSPVYWFVKGNETISETCDFSPSQIRDILMCYGIQILFFITFTLVGMVIRRQQNQRRVLDKKHA